MLCEKKKKKKKEKRKQKKKKRKMKKEKINNLGWAFQLALCILFPDAILAHIRPGPVTEIPSSVS